MDIFDLHPLRNPDPLLNMLVPCLDHGFVRLVDAMPRICPDNQTCDFAVVQAARTSVGLGLKTASEDKNLIRYLMRNKHTSPFEMVEFKFHCQMPIFVARQWIRHRTANVNEFSGRYAEMKDLFYQPLDWRGQDKQNKQGSTGIIDYEPIKVVWDALAGESEGKSLEEASYFEYKRKLAKGVSKELARIGLPLNCYTQWYWKIDLKNLLDFLSLRCDKHAQYEIRVFADAMLQLIAPLVPTCVEAWEDYNTFRGGIAFSRLELELLFNPHANTEQILASMSKGEIAEFEQKKNRLLIP